MSNDNIEYTRPMLIAGNIALFLWIILATLAVWFYNQTGGYLFFVFSAAAVFLVLRRAGCNTCPYCKTCTQGFGKLSVTFFGKRKLKVMARSGFGTAIFTYILLGVVPAAVLAFSIVQAFDLLKLTVFVCLLAITFYSVATWRKKP